MVRTAIGLVLSLSLTAVLAGAVSATPPEPNHCSVSPADAMNGPVFAPDGPQPVPASIQTIVIRNTDNNPLPNALVEVIPYSGLRTCAGAVFSGTTDENGRLVLTLAGGGCFHGYQACWFRANGVFFRTYDYVTSPDWDGAQADGRVDLADLTEFCRERAAGGAGCHDYNHDSQVNLSDLVIFSSAYAPQHTCP